MLIDDVADAPHKFNLRIVKARLARVAAFARAKACLLRRFRNLEKAHLFALRTSRRTRWPAINSGRAYGENKAAIARSVALEYSIPKFGIVRSRGHFRCHLHFFLPHYFFWFESPARRGRLFFI